MKLNRKTFMNLTTELRNLYFPNVKYLMDDERGMAVKYAVECCSNGVLPYRKFIKTLGYNCGDNLENIHAIVSKHVLDFEGFKWHSRTIDKIITHVGYSMRGAPMGRSSIGTHPHLGTEKVFDCAVPMSSDGAYDRGGAYWGIGKQLRVKYTKDLSYVHFYRRGEE